MGSPKGSEVDQLELEESEEQITANAGSSGLAVSSLLKTALFVLTLLFTAQRRGCLWKRQRTGRQEAATQPPDSAVATRERPEGKP